MEVNTKSLVGVLITYNYDYKTHSCLDITIQNEIVSKLLTVMVDKLERQSSNLNDVLTNASFISDFLDAWYMEYCNTSISKL